IVLCLYLIALLRRSFTCLRRAFANELVPVVCGTDYVGWPADFSATEFRLMHELGLSPLRCLQSATSTAADMLGLSESVGTLRVGRMADIVALPAGANPLADLSVMSRIDFVMVAGNVVRHDSGTEKGALHHLL